MCVKACEYGCLCGGWMFVCTSVFRMLACLSVLADGYERKRKKRTESYYPSYTHSEHRPGIRNRSALSGWQKELKRDETAMRWMGDWRS